MSFLDCALRIKMHLEILYQDEQIVAVNKPHAMLVHKSMIDRHEKVYVMKLLRDQLNQWVYPIHRLDKPTSGVLLFALNSDMARELSEAFKARDTQKEYLAVVRGYTKEKELIDYPLKEQHDKIADKMVQENKAAQEAITHYNKLGQIELPYPVGPYTTSRYSLLHVRPQTGRKHQLRRHLKHIFHPIVGDTTHGDLRHNRSFRDNLEVNRLLLHAKALTFTHPLHKKMIKIEADVDTSFQKVINLFAK